MYFDEDEYFEAVRVFEKADAEANRVRSEVFSFIRGQMPSRVLTDEDIAIMEKSHKAWEKVLKIARLPLKP